jgi:hypothetical protein
MLKKSLQIVFHPKSYTPKQNKKKGLHSPKRLRVLKQKKSCQGKTTTQKGSLKTHTRTQEIKLRKQSQKMRAEDGEQSV